MNLPDKIDEEDIENKILDNNLNFNQFKIKKRDMAHRRSNKVEKSLSRESSDIYYNPNLSNPTRSLRENTNDPSSHYLSDIDDPMEVLKHK